MNSAMQTSCRATIIAIALSLSVLAVAGCRVDQQREVATYRKILDLAPTTGQSPATALSLRDALLLANRNNENLSIAGESYLRALIARKRTVANFVPTVDLVGSYSRRDPVSSDSSSGGGSPQNSTFDLSAELDWNLFDGLRDINRYWRDTFLIEQQRHSLLAFQESLLLDVARIYYQVMRSEASVRVLENSLQLQEERLRDARGRLEAGVAPPLDVAQTEAQVSQTRTMLINARRDVQRARDLLVLLSGAEVSSAALSDGFELPASRPLLDGWLQTARANRHDLLAASAAIDAARREVEVAFGQYYPSVSLNLGAFLYRESVPTERDWDALLTANLPIFSAGRIHADVRQAWSFYREALLVGARLEREVTQQVQQAYHDLTSSDARLAELRVRLAAAEMAFQQAEGSYRVGRATNLDRVAAQDALLDAQLQIASEAFDRKVNYLFLLQASGVLREQIEAGFVTATTQPAAR
ncbi:TolC family protein [Fontivita pretiosa]|uniref:TolC family protein n=1 Tax=Fontivita pretiosa TaxID=2989684 RepID=UPI003D184F2F